MKTRPPLNGLTPRTMQEASHDPYDYLECARRTPWLLRWARPLANVLGVICIFACLGIALGWGGRPFP
jgi:hypothetical protein